MIRDGNCIQTPQHADICIIGTGPAGITAAYCLQKTGLNVILLDGSRKLDYGPNDYYKDSWGDKKLLYDGLSNGIFKDNEPDFLIRPNFGITSPSERERVYGGTSTHWGGQSRPLDPIVFEKRSGFPGWPISRKDLDPYYKQASELFDLVGDYGTDGVNFTAEFWLSEMKKQGLDVAIPSVDGFDVEMYQFLGTNQTATTNQKNFAVRTIDGVVISDTSVNVIVNATVLDIVHQGGSVSHLNVASMKEDDKGVLQKDTEFTVTAKTYVLACGAVANARQMLLSDIGNDKVGRYFMCHPLSRNGIIETAKSYLSTPELNLMNGRNYQPTADISGITGRFIANAGTAKDNEIGRCWFWANSEGGDNQMYFEMAPTKESFVALDESPGAVDPVFGQKQTHIHWAFTPLDKTTYETNCDLFSKSSPKFPDDPIITWPDWDATNDPYWGNIAKQWTVNGHHIGTTRMSYSSTEGVVDQNLKIHGMDNMYVAGSSVFPSTGISNPTFTIIALSIRLADHLSC